MENVMPNTFEYKVQKYIAGENDFEAVIHLKCKNEDELMQWKRSPTYTIISVAFVINTNPRSPPPLANLDQLKMLAIICVSSRSASTHNQLRLGLHANFWFPRSAQPGDD